MTTLEDKLKKIAEDRIKQEDLKKNRDLLTRIKLDRLGFFEF